MAQRLQRVEVDWLLLLLLLLILLLLFVLLALAVLDAEEDDVDDDVVVADVVVAGVEEEISRLWPLSQISRYCKMKWSEKQSGISYNHFVLRIM